MLSVTFVYILSLLEPTLNLCLFDNHHNKRFEAGASEILHTVHVRGAAQCKQACVSYDGQCSAVNLKVSKQSGGFICELFKEGLSFNKDKITSDHDCTFMKLQGECHGFPISDMDLYHLNNNCMVSLIQ